MFRIGSIVVTAFAVLLFTGGCTARAAYDSLRYNQELRCQELQGSSRDECLRRTGMSYDEYQRQMKERDAK